MISKMLKIPLLLILAVCTLIFSLSSSADSTPTNPSHQYQVIIIGAGAAGLAAAQELYQHGIQDVLVVEARDRIGGRVWTTHPWGAATDLGASWIHRINNNPLAKLAQQYAVTTTPTIYSLGNPVTKFTSFEIYDAQGARIPTSEIQATLELIKQFDVAISTNKLLLGKNVSFEDATNAFASEQHLQGNKLQLFNFIAKDMIENDTGADLNQVSLPAAMSIHSTLSGKDVLPQGGYIRIFSELAKNISISLNTPVRAIQYGSQGVSVIIANKVFHAKYAVVTLPLGVLQAGTVQFTPALPKEKMASIRRLRMGFLNKVYLLFDKPFWDSNTEWISIMPGKEKPKDHYEALNLYKFVQQPILLFFSAGSFSEETEAWTNQQIIGDIMHYLKLIYGDKIPAPTAYLVTRWGKDPYARGSYSYPYMGSTLEDYKTLAAPVANQLFFAGEATNSTDPSTVHGAYMSGIAAADLILKTLN